MDFLKIIHLTQRQNFKFKSFNLFYVFNRDSRCNFTLSDVVIYQLPTVHRVSISDVDLQTGWRLDKQRIRRGNVIDRDGKRILVPICSFSVGVKVKKRCWVYLTGPLELYMYYIVYIYMYIQVGKEW